MDKIIPIGGYCSYHCAPESWRKKQGLEPESQHLEWKLSLSLKREAMESLCGMLNADEGHGAIVFGVSPDGEIIGVEPGNLDKEQRSLSQYISGNFEPAIQHKIYVREEAGKTILTVSARRNRDIPYHEFRGNAFIREGTRTRRLSQKEKHSLLADRSVSGNSGIGNQHNSKPRLLKRAAVFATLCVLLVLAVVVWRHRYSRQTSYNNNLPRPTPIPPSQVQPLPKATHTPAKQNVNSPYTPFAPSKGPKREYGPEQLPPGGEIPPTETEQRQDELKSISQRELAKIVIEANSRMRINAREWDVPPRMAPDIGANEQDPKVLKQWQDETERISQENWNRPKLFRAQFEKKFADERLILDELRARLLPPHSAGIDIDALPRCNVFFNKGEYPNRDVWECVDDLDEIVRDNLDK